MRKKPEKWGLSLNAIVRKSGQGKRLTADEAKLLAEFRRRAPAWSSVYESAINGEHVRLPWKGSTKTT